MLASVLGKLLLVFVVQGKQMLVGSSGMQLVALLSGMRAGKLDKILVAGQDRRLHCYLFFAEGTHSSLVAVCKVVELPVLMWLVGCGCERVVG